jgi:hypothetical protein
MISIRRATSIKWKPLVQTPVTLRSFVCASALVDLAVRSQHATKTAHTQRMNFDTFLPDLLVGIATGLVVGFVLYVTQNRSQSRRNHAEAEFAWQSFKPRLASAASHAWEQDTNSLETAEPAALVALDEIGSREPLALWKRNLKTPDPLLDTLIELLQQRPALAAAATAFESTVQNLNPRFLNPFSEHFPVLLRIVRTRAYGLSDAVAMEWIPGAILGGDYRLSEATDLLLHSTPPLNTALATYQASAFKYVELIAKFQALLDADATVPAG